MVQNHQKPHPLLNPYTCLPVRGRAPYPRYELHARWPVPSREIQETIREEYVAGGLVAQRSCSQTPSLATGGDSILLLKI